MIRQILANYNKDNHEGTVKLLQIFLYKTSIRHLQSAYSKNGGRVPVAELRKSVSDKIRDLRKILDELDPPKKRELFKYPGLEERLKIEVDPALLLTKKI